VITSLTACRTGGQRRAGCPTTCAVGHCGHRASRAVMNRPGQRPRRDRSRPERGGVYDLGDPVGGSPSVRARRRRASVVRTSEGDQLLVTNRPEDAGHRICLAPPLSCSYAARRPGRFALPQGAQLHRWPWLELASTNLVVELGIIRACSRLAFTVAGVRGRPIRSCFWRCLWPVRRKRLLTRRRQQADAPAPGPWRTRGQWTMRHPGLGPICRRSRSPGASTACLHILRHGVRRSSRHRPGPPHRGAIAAVGP